MPELLLVPAVPGAVLVLLEPPVDPISERVPELEYVPGAAPTDPLTDPPAEPMPEAVPEAEP